ncbi:MAG: L-fucokinase, partial [Candidatus Omnitrophota bacterium]
AEAVEKKLLVEADDYQFVRVNVRDWMTALYAAEDKSKDAKGKIGVTLWSLRQLDDEAGMQDDLKIKPADAIEKAKIILAFNLSRYMTLVMASRGLMDTGINIMDMAEALNKASIGQQCVFMLTDNKFTDHHSDKDEPAKTTDGSIATFWGFNQDEKMLRLFAYLSGGQGYFTYIHTNFTMKSETMNGVFATPGVLSRIRNMLILDRNANVLNLDKFIEDVKRMISNSALVVNVSHRGTTNTQMPVGDASRLVEEGHGNSMLGLNDKIGTGWGNMMAVYYSEVMDALASSEYPAIPLTREAQKVRTDANWRYYGLVGFTPNAIGISEDFWAVLQQTHNAIGLGHTPQFAMSYAFWHKLRESYSTTEWTSAAPRWSGGLNQTTGSYIQQNINELGPESIFEREARRNVGRFYITSPLALFTLFSLIIAILFDWSPFTGVNVLYLIVGVLFNQVLTLHGLGATVRASGLIVGLARWFENRLRDVQLFATRSVFEAIAFVTSYFGLSFKFEVSGGGGAYNSKTKLADNIWKDIKNPRQWKILSLTTVFIIGIALTFLNIVCLAVGLDVSNVVMLFLTLYFGASIVTGSFTLDNKAYGRTSGFSAFLAKLSGFIAAMITIIGVQPAFLHNSVWILLSVIIVSGALALHVYMNRKYFAKKDSKEDSDKRWQRVSTEMHGNRFVRRVSEFKTSYWMTVTALIWFALVPFPDAFRYTNFAGKPVSMSFAKFTTNIGVAIAMIVLIIFVGKALGHLLRNQLTARYIKLSDKYYSQMETLVNDDRMKIGALLSQFLIFIDQEAYRYAKGSLDAVELILSKTFRNPSNASTSYLGHYTNEDHLVIDAEIVEAKKNSHSFKLQANFSDWRNNSPENYIQKTQDAIELCYGLEAVIPQGIGRVDIYGLLKAVNIELVVVHNHSPTAIDAHISATKNLIYIIVPSEEAFKSLGIPSLGCILLHEAIELAAKQAIVKEGKSWDKTLAQEIHDFAKKEEVEWESVIYHRYDRRQMREVYDSLYKTGWRVSNIYQTAFSRIQAQMFNSQIDPSIYPKGTQQIKAIPDFSSPNKGVKAKGNGLANLGIIKTAIEEIVRKLNLEPGTYNLKDILGNKLIVGVHGGGQSARNPKYTQLGKFNGILPISALNEDRPTTLQEELLASAAVISKIYPDNKPAYINLYGDALITFNPGKIKELLEQHSELTDETIILLRRVPASEATQWGCAAVDENNKILNFIEKPTKGKFCSEDERKEMLNKDGLLVDNEYVLMNTAFAVLGIGAIIRWAMLAGIDIDFDGNFKVLTKGGVGYSNLSALDLVSAYGGEIDTFGTLVPPLAVKADLGKIIFSDTEDKLKAMQQQITNSKTDIYSIYRHISEEIENLRTGIHKNVITLEEAGRELDKIVVSLSRQIESSEDDGAVKFLSDILSAVGRARMYHLITSVMRHPGLGSQAFAVQVEGEWLDTGQTGEESDIILGKGNKNQKLNLVFDTKRSVGSLTNEYSEAIPSCRYASIVTPQEGSLIAPNSIQVKSCLTGKVELGAESQVHLVNWPGELHLRNKAVMSEATVKKENKEWIVHLLWGLQDVPKESENHLGSPLREWVKDMAVYLGVQPNDLLSIIWEPAAKHILISAKLFPGLSREALENNKPVDELDRELFEAMPQIWKFLQDHMLPPPQAWVKALRAGRLFSMDDVYNNPAVELLKARRKLVEDKLAETLPKQNSDPARSKSGLALNASDVQKDLTLAPTKEENLSSKLS